MNERDRRRYDDLFNGLQTYETNVRLLPGIVNARARDCLIRQMIDSIHRVEYVTALQNRPISQNRANPAEELLFDPLKAAIYYQRNGNIDEAFWLVFLFVHFGKNARGGWRYAREVYGRLGQGGLWNWANTSANPAAFRMWLEHHQEDLKRPGVPGGFGNHRKYQSLNAYGNNGTGHAVASYVEWVSEHQTHQNLINHALHESGGAPRTTFNYLYKSMSVVASFGRIAKFDYLTMLGKLQLAAIVPDSAYMNGATGPAKGADLLFGSASIATQDARIIELDATLDVGMQVLEDSICNWQKSPRHFLTFRG